MPVVNVPILSYTLEFLVSNGIEEIFIFCSAHAEKIERYVKSVTSSFPSLVSPSVG